MSTAAAKTDARLMTAEEFAAFVSRPENDNKWFELVRGEVIELPPPQQPHGFVTNNLGRILGNFTFKKGKYFVLNDAGVILERDPDTVRGPDVAVYDGVQHFADLPQSYAEVSPLLAVEVLSPNNRANQVMLKLTDYLQNRVGLVWMVDPERRIVTVYTSDTGPRVYHEKDTITGADVLPGFKCKVAEIFRMPGDKAPSARKRKT